MKRLHIVNFIGVLVLAMFSAVQWTQNRDLNLEFNRLQKKNYDQGARQQELESNLKGSTGDLAEIKARLEQARQSTDEMQRQLHHAQGEARQVANEREHMRSSVTNWTAAVALRDERLKLANTEIQKLSDRLNQRLREYNELASNHNALVTNWNAVMKELARQGAVSTNRVK